MDVEKSHFENAFISIQRATKKIVGIEKTFTIYPSYVADLVENPQNKNLIYSYLPEDILLSAIKDSNYNNDIFLVKLVLQVKIFDKFNLRISDK